ncbi:hypothetical protein DENIS_2488 [Desulfonema ishimotonii]|uniref:TonB C-terminal domain-containing protein n=1 Tax=Desulfonema ishimotonii TaxID=45657 RepID=A0A401FX47_9BACT|nr:TonB family protein [Desulfonema ishimotonii]GBC61526.1 hypothetical protein DENIS_2488 [Desulfonema ishimotonii]
MNTRIQTYEGTSLLHGKERRYGIGILMVTMSVICHVLMVTGFVFMPDFLPRHEFISPGADSVITVDIISMDGDVPDLGAVDAAPPAAEPEVPLVMADESEVQGETPEVVAPPVPLAEELEPALTETPAALPDEVPPPVAEIPSEEQVVIRDAPEKALPSEMAEKPAEKTDPAVRTIKRNPKTRKPEKLKQQVVKPEAVRTESIRDAVSKIRKKVVRDIARSGKKPGTPYGRPGGTGKGGTGGSINDVYKAQLRYKIEQNWIFSEQLAGISRDLRSIVSIRVLPDGSIADIWFERRSGNDYLDDSAYRAVVKADPLPPLPSEYSEYTFSLRFSPAGLR